MEKTVNSLFQIAKVTLKIIQNTVENTFLVEFSLHCAADCLFQVINMKFCPRVFKLISLSAKRSNVFIRANRIRLFIQGWLISFNCIFKHTNISQC
jgi:hypothetical protein